MPFITSREIQYGGYEINHSFQFFFHYHVNITDHSDIFAYNIIPFSYKIKPLDLIGAKRLKSLLTFLYQKTME